MEDLKNDLKLSGIKLRWLNVQCYEICLSNGITILFDPQFSDPLPDDEKAKYYKIPEEYHLNRESIERVDYLIINHSHCDHIIDLGYFAKKFNPLIICPEMAVYDLAKVFDIPFTSFYPVGAGEVHEFPDFTLNTIHGCHMPQPFTYSNMPNIMDKSYGVTGNGTMEIGHWGSLTALNYVLTLKENLRIGFLAGRMDLPSYPGLMAMRTFHPNIILRQIPVRLPEYAAKIFAEELAVTKAQLMLPMHHEMYDISQLEFLNQLIQDINDLAAQYGAVGRIFRPVRGKWYSVNIGISQL